MCAETERGHLGAAVVHLGTAGFYLGTAVFYLGTAMLHVGTECSLLGVARIVVCAASNEVTTSACINMQQHQVS